MRFIANLWKRRDPILHECLKSLRYNNLGSLWNHENWEPVHGDNKAMSKGVFKTQPMICTQNPFLVREVLRSKGAYHTDLTGIFEEPICFPTREGPLSTQGARKRPSRTGSTMTG